MFKYQIDTCINQLNNRIEKKAMEECHVFIVEKRESRHLKTLERQRDKFEQLSHKNTGGHSNVQNGEKLIKCGIRT